MPQQTARTRGPLSACKGALAAGGSCHENITDYTVPRSKQEPELTRKQCDFLELYMRLQAELGRSPMLKELGAEAGYSEGSETAGAQKMLDKLVAAGLIEKPQLLPVGGGVTAKGLAALARHKGKTLR